MFWASFGFFRFSKVRLGLCMNFGFFLKLGKMVFMVSRLNKNI